MSAAGLLELCRTAVQTGLVLLLQTGLILLLGLGVGWALRQRGPQAQSLAYRVTLLAVLLIALLSPTLVHGRRALWRVSLPSTAPTPSAAPAVADTALAPEPGPMPVHTLKTPPPNVTGNTGPVDAPPVSSVTPPVHASRFHAADAFLLTAELWLTGTFALLAWLGLGQASLMVLQRRSVPAGGEATALLTHLCAVRGLTAPLLLASPRVVSPFLAGVWRPAVFLPASYAQDFDTSVLRAILAHELGHLERRDNAWMLLTRLTCALFWPQPMLWALSRRMAQVAEEACDGLALVHGCAPRAYADCLLSLAERLAPTRLERSMGTSVVPFRSHVGRRVQQVLQARRLPVLPVRLRVVIAGGALCAVIAGPLLVSAADTSREKAHAASPRTAPSGAIIGRITYENGQPASGVEVWTTMQARSAGTYGAAGDWDIVGKRISVVSSVDGSFRLTGLQKGHYVVVEQEATGQWVAAARENVAVLPGKTTSVTDLVLTHGAFMTGTVTDKATGRPVPGISVLALGPRYPASMLGASSTQTDTEGHYSLRLVPGDNWVYVSGNGYESSNIGIDPVNNSNPKYPGYARGFHVTLRQGQTRTVPIFAVRAASRTPSSAARPVSVSPDAANVAGRLGFVRADNTPIRAGRERGGRVLSIVARGQNLAISGETATDYVVLMIDHSLGYVAKSAVKLLNYQVVSDKQWHTLGQRLVEKAETYLGTPYVRGSDTRDGMDDGALVRAVYGAVGISLPRGAEKQAGVGYDVPHNIKAGDWTQWAPGDRLYFALRRPGIDHTAIYIGNGLFIHASRDHGGQVAIDRADNAYYSPHLVAVRRSAELLREPPMPGDRGQPAQAATHPPLSLAAEVTRDTPPPAVARARFLAGLTPVQGPGLVVTLRDSKKPLPHFPKGAFPGGPNLIHDADINQVVDELKAAGAEAIAVNDQRLVGMSPIRCAGPTVYVNNVPQAPPFIVRAIGNARALQAALNLPNGVADGLRRMDPAMITMQRSANLTIPAYNGAAQPRYAHPVASASLETLNNQLADAQVAYITVKGTVDMLTQELHTTAPQTKIRLDLHSRPEVQQAVVKLNQEQAALQAIRTRYTPDYPPYKQAQTQFQADKDAYHRLLRQPYIITRKNPVYATLQAQLAVRRQQQRTSEETIASLTRQIQMQVQTSASR